MTYYGNWAPHSTDYRGQKGGYAEMVADFRVQTPPPEDTILFAAYLPGDYSGAAIVLFEQDGKLFHVEGAHCSCMGLEGQWEPQPTSWAAEEQFARSHSFKYYDGNVEAMDGLRALITSRLGRETR